jgi:hypothetical protein
MKWKVFFLFNVDQLEYCNQIVDYRIDQKIDPEFSAILRSSGRRSKEAERR